MNTPTYKEQFDKLTEAYIRGEVNHNNDFACFVGNLLNRSRWWSKSRYISVKATTWEVTSVFNPDKLHFIYTAIANEANGLYTPVEIIRLEKKFLETFYKEYQCFFSNMTDKYENAIFVAFEETLELLKQIHISKGEIIDETPKFTKRELQKS